MENELKRRQLELRKNELEMKYQILEKRRAASQLDHYEMNDLFIKPSIIKSPINCASPPPEKERERP